MSPYDDIAIVGGGLAGLSLAVQLVEHSVPARITVIDPRDDYSDDRTWCFWDVMAHPFRDAVSHRWPAWRVTTSKARSAVSSRHYPYCRLPAGAFYQRALAQLRKAEHVRLALGHEVTSVAGQDRNVLIHTNAGPLTADIAFDARPPEIEQWAGTSHPFLWQAFEGWRVQTERPFWETSTVDLMDFSDRPDPNAIGFLYTLPLAPDEALVESTTFAPPGRTRADHGGHIQRALAANLGETHYTVAAREAGRIPMTSAIPRPPRDTRIIPIGTRAGAPRPSSGYAFLPIQSHSQRLAAQLASGRYPGARMRRSTTRWLDGIFLRRLRRQPESAPALFQRLFDRVPADRLVRFLTETGSLQDHLAVMSALPIAGFASEAIIGPARPLPAEN